MNLNTFICCLMSLTAAACFSPHKETIIQGKLNIPDTLAHTLYVKQQDSTYTIRPDSAQHTFILELPCDSSHFITLYGTIGSNEELWPFSQTLFINAGQNVRLGLTPENRTMKIKTDAKDKNNTTLCAYQQFYLEHARELWTTPPTAQQAEKFLEAYRQKADELIRQNQPAPEVQQYLTIHSYLDFTSGVKSLKYIYQEDPANQLPQNTGQSLPPPEQMLDNPTALLFSETISTIFSSLRKEYADPEVMLQSLQHKYTNPDIIQKVTRHIVQNHIQNYNYTQNFEEGLEQLKRLCTNLSTEESDEFIQEFTSRRFSVEGAPLPDVILEDKEGKQHKLSDFKGKYLYIDLWASWCGPCCAEIPHLQKLEKQVKNPQVEFISISLDQKREDWIKKMEQLDMKGNQYIVTDDQLSAMLNIQGIPHFLIYDKTGILSSYKAPRPSSGKTLVNILENLK